MEINQRYMPFLFFFATIPWMPSRNKKTQNLFSRYICTLQDLFYLPMLSHFTEYHENFSGVPITCHIIRLLLVWNPIFLWGPLAVPCSDDPGRMGGPCNIDNTSKSHMDLLPDTQNCGLRMRRECMEHFPRHRLQWKPLVNDPGMHHGTCITHVPWCMSGSLTRGGGENVPGIPGACATNS